MTKKLLWFLQQLFLFVSFCLLFTFVKSPYMRSKIALIFVCLLPVLVLSCKTSQNTNSVDIKLKTINDTVSYILGSDVALNFKKNNIEINSDVFVAAFRKSMKEDDTLFSLDARQKIMSKFQKELQVRQQTRILEESKKNKLAAQAFLQENRAKDGVVELASGLQYIIIKPGPGKKPGPDDEVTVNYEGKFLNGEIFDSSYDRNEPVSFPLNGVIKGWTEGLQLMNEGAVYEFFIPSELGYGDSGYGQIPGGAALIFKVELISVKAKQ